MDVYSRFLGRAVPLCRSRDRTATADALVSVQSGASSGIAESYRDFETGGDISLTAKVSSEISRVEQSSGGITTPESLK